MTKIRVKTKEELIKEFGVYNGKPVVPEPNPDLQGQVVNAVKICPNTGDAFLKDNPIPLDNCVYTVEKVQ